MDIGNTIREIANECLENDSFFIVDIIVKGVSDRTKVLILLDGDNGVNIDNCAKLSRQVGSRVEEGELLDISYILEVSSPGLDHPLKLQRQYKKNIGKELKVITTTGNTLKGELLKVSGSSLELNNEIKEKKKVSYQSVTVPFDEIEKANVLVSFK